MDASARATAMLLREFLEEDPRTPRYGFELMRRLGLSSAQVYPILARLQHIGWIEAGHEESAPATRPPRRTYRLTADGVRAARQELAAVADADFRSSKRALLPALGGAHA